MIQLAIHEAINGRDLDYAIARATMEEMMDGTATDIEMATLLTPHERRNHHRDYRLRRGHARKGRAH